MAVNPYMDGKEKGREIFPDLFSLIQRAAVSVLSVMPEGLFLDGCDARENLALDGLEHCAAAGGNVAYLV